MKRRLTIGLLLLFLFSTYNIKFNKNFFSNLQIKNITIENNKIIKGEEIKEKLSFLYKTNFFFFKNKKYRKKTKRNSIYWKLSNKKNLPKQS